MLAFPIAVSAGCQIGGQRFLESLRLFENLLLLRILPAKYSTRRRLSGLRQRHALGRLDLELLLRGDDVRELLLRLLSGGELLLGLLRGGGLLRHLLRGLREILRGGLLGLGRCRGLSGLRRLRGLLGIRRSLLQCRRGGRGHVRGLFRKTIGFLRQRGLPRLVTTTPAGWSRWTCR